MIITIILGTRPEIIKMAPIIKELEKEGQEFFIIHTGQHYSYNMDQIFLEQFKIPKPRYHLGVGSGTHAEETAKMMMGIERVLMKERPALALIEGDTNTVLAGALACAKLGLPIGHVEAGLRSFDRSMPEEVNRVVADHVSDLLFAPTERAKLNLLREGLAADKIFVTGNTIVDTVLQNLSLADGFRARSLLEKLGLTERSYFLVTLHRQENVDDPRRLKGILEGLRMVRDEFGMPIIYPVHPRSKEMLERHSLKADGITCIEPLDYLSFLALESKARLILTDSGGVQEEACILGVPCVTLRCNTERPETLEVGANILAGVEPTSILEKAAVMMNGRRDWPNPFGDGRAAERIVRIIKESFYDDGFKIKQSRSI